MKAIQKILVAILAAMFLIALSFTAAFASENRNGEASLSLLMPETYEQYLELTAPSDIAVSEQYIAIADGSTIYLYDRTAGGAYKTFTYTSNVKSLNFYKHEGNTYLYFTANIGGNNPILYIDCAASDFAGQPAVQTAIKSCSAFVIREHEVCFANAQNAVYLTKMDSADSLNIIDPTTSDPLQSESGNAVSFTIYNGTIYFSVEKVIFTAAFAAGTSTPEKTQWTTAEQIISSFAIVDGTCYYVAAGRFYRQTSQTAQGYEDLASANAVVCGDQSNVYLLQNNSILEYSVAANAPTGYEFAKYSTSVNRLSGAAARVSARGGKLLIADTAGNRVLQYDGNTYNKLYGAEQLSPSLICAGDEAFAVYGNSKLSVLGYDGKLVSETTVSGAVGIAYAYGTFYCVAGDGKTYTASAVVTDSAAGSVNLSSVRGLAADIFGNLYVLENGTTVYRFTAEQFITAPATLEVAATFSKPMSNILCAYDGTVYGVTDSAIQRYDAAEKKATEIPVDLTKTVTGADSAVAKDFAFDFESGEVYVLSDGFMVTADLGASAPASLKNIAADGLYAALNGSAAGTSGLLVDVPEQSVVIELQASAVRQDTAVLPYAGFSRTDSARTGVKICEIGAGTVVAFYRYSPDGDTTEYAREYSLCLVPGETNPLDGYYTAQSFGARTTNETALLRFPTMHIGDTQNAIERLARGTSVTVLGKVSLPAPATGGYGLDIDHYYVRTSVNGQTVFGYLPCGYVVEDSASNGGGYATTEFVYRYVKRNESITLYRNDQPIELSDRERVKMYGEPNENGEVYVTYTDENGTWSGYVPEDCLFAASPAATIILVVVMLVTAAVLVSACYLVLRKPPMLQ